MRSSRWRKEFCFARLGRGGDKVERNGGRTWGRDRGGDGGSVWRGQGADVSQSASGTGHAHERERDFTGWASRAGLFSNSGGLGPLNIQTNF
jgi:hypothetical protein